MIRGSLQEKNGIYQAVLFIDGKYKWKSTGIKAKRGNKRLAEAKLKEFVDAYDDNPNAFEKTDFIAFSRQWLKNISSDIDAITLQGYKQHLEKHIIPYFEPLHLSLQSFTTAHIDNYYRYKTEGGQLDGKEGGLCRASIKRHSVVLNLIFEEAMRYKLIKENPCKYAKIPKQNNIPTAKREFYTVKQCEDLLKVTQNTVLYDMIYITFMYGLRRSELMGLKWDAVDFVNGTITIKHTVVIGSSVISKDKTKNKSSYRTYPLLDDVKEILLRLQKQQQEYKQLFGNCYHDIGGYVFTKEDGSAYYPDYPTKRLEAVIKRYDLPHIRWHDLRHSCASMLLTKGWNMKAISEWLGHADISTTMDIYGHLDLEYKRTLANSLNGLLSNV